MEGSILIEELNSPPYEGGFEEKNEMEWTRSETLALALHNCTSCRGLGLRIGKRGGIQPCNCVLRNIFRACFNRFKYCQEKEKHMTRAAIEFVAGRDRKITWGRKDEEYSADFMLIIKRTLTSEEYKLFSFHYLLGADWKLCCRRMKFDRGLFFHAAYRIEQKLGKVFREIQPYALYPLNDYFHSSRPSFGANQNQPLQEDDFEPRVTPVRPPMLLRLMSKKKAEEEEEDEFAELLAA